MPSKKTVRRKRKDRRRTLKKLPGKKRHGGGDTQSITIPTTAFGEKIGTPEPSNSIK